MPFTKKTKSAPNRAEQDAKSGKFYTFTEIIAIVGCDPAGLREAINSGLITQRKHDNKISLRKVVAWREANTKKRNEAHDLNAAKKQAEIDKLQAAKTLQDIEIAKARGELHVGKKCNESLAELLVTVWREIQAMPNRVQSAFPENKQIQKVTTDIVNETAKRLQDYFTQRTGKKLDVVSQEKEQEQ